MFDRENWRKVSIGEYDPMLRNFLKQGQKMHTELFTTGVYIGDFILRISLRRVTTTEADNNNVENATVELINLWRNR